MTADARLRSAGADGVNDVRLYTVEAAAAAAAALSVLLYTPLAAGNDVWLVPSGTIIGPHTNGVEAGTLGAVTSTAAGVHDGIPVNGALAARAHEVELVAAGTVAVRGRLARALGATLTGRGNVPLVVAYSTDELDVGAILEQSLDVTAEISTDMAVYIVNNSVRMKVTFKDRDGVLVDPLAVNLRVQSPAGSTVDVTPTRVSQGIYLGVFVAVFPGPHRYRWYTVTPNLQVEGSFSARHADVH